MSRQVKPVERCQNCKTQAPCLEVNPPPRFHSGWECTRCGEIRWGGVLSAAPALLIGYAFSNGSVLCWRCHRLHTVAPSMEGTLNRDKTASATNYPRLSYLFGFMTTLWSDSKDPLDRYCDECGNLVNKDC